MNRTALIQAVALKMDEITPGNGVIIPVDGSDNNPLYSLIDGVVDDGVLQLFSVAPYWRLPQTAFVNSGTPGDIDVKIESLGAAFGNRKYIRLRVNADFFRLAEIGCPDFLRPITEVFGEQDAIGKRQHNRHLMGREAKPVGVMSHGMWQGASSEIVQVREIDCYSLASDSTVEADDVEASYIAKPGTIGSSTNSVETVLGGSSVLVPALTWLIASLAFGARGDANHAAVCQQYANNLLV